MAEHDLQTTNQTELERIQASIKKIQEQVGTLTTQTDSITGGLNLEDPSTGTSSIALNEIDQSPPAIDTTTSLSSTLATADGLTANIPTTESIAKAREDVAKDIEKQQAGLKSLLEEDKPKALSETEISAKVFERLGLPSDFEKQQFAELTAASARIASLKGEIQKINILESQKILSLEGQGGIAGIVLRGYSVYTN